MKTDISFKFSKVEIDDAAHLANYNKATNYKDVISFVSEDDENDEYIIMDCYCKNPDCGCTDILLDFVVKKDGKITDKIISIDYNYKTRKILHSEDDLPADFEKDLINNDEINEAFKSRHLRIKAAYLQWHIEHPLYIPNLKIGRNDPCTCGSGKKYKKCCGA
jgi:hypothetical protein